MTTLRSWAAVLFAVALAAAVHAAPARAQPAGATDVQHWAGEFETRQSFRPRLFLAATFWREGQAWRGVLNIPPDVGITGVWGVDLLHVEVGPDRIEFFQANPNPDAPPNLYSVQRHGRDADTGEGSVSLAGGAPLKLRMWRISADEARDVMPRRPQTPRPPLPYQSRDIMVPNTRDGETVRVRGVLAIPPGEGPFPTAVLLPATGRRDADHTESGHKPMAVIADRLARAGIASMRLEGRHPRDPFIDVRTQVSPSQLAAEAAEAVAWLVQQPWIDPARLALVGLNEGCTVGAIASRLLSPPAQVRAAVFLGPQGMSGLEQIRAEFGASMRREGESPAFIDQRSRTFMKAYELLAADAPESEVVEAFFEEITANHLSRRQQLGEWQPEQRRQLAARQFEVVHTPAFVEMLRTDPAAAFVAVPCPVLAVLGGLDDRFPLSVNRPAVERAFERRAAPSRLVVYDNLNHRMQPAQTGAPDEMEQIETTIDGRVLSDMVNFLREHLGVPASKAGEGR